MGLTHSQPSSARPPPNSFDAVRHDEWPRSGLQTRAAGSFVCLTAPYAVRQTNVSLATPESTRKRQFVSTPPFGRASRPRRVSPTEIRVTANDPSADKRLPTLERLYVNGMAAKPSLWPRECFRLCLLRVARPPKSQRTGEHHDTRRADLGAIL